MIDYLTYSPEETKQTIESLELEMGSPEEYQVSQLVKVIRGQHEEAELFDNGWLDIWCVNSDNHCEVSNGPKESLQEFAARCFELGWAVHDLKNNKAICHACSNAPDTSDYACQYRSDSGGILS